MNLADCMNKFEYSICTIYIPYIFLYTTGKKKAYTIDNIDEL